MHDDAAASRHILLQREVPRSVLHNIYAAPGVSERPVIGAGRERRIAHDIHGFRAVKLCAGQAVMRFEPHGRHAVAVGVYGVGKVHDVERHVVFVRAVAPLHHDLVADIEKFRGFAAAHDLLYRALVQFGHARHLRNGDGFKAGRDALGIRAVQQVCQIHSHIRSLLMPPHM